MLASGFKYRGLIEYFERISAIPRPTFSEEKIADYICDFARERGFFTLRDEHNNVFVRMPASKGREGEDAILLQGHTDMVCEKNADVEHDFYNDGIELYESDGYIRARGTTLGADNGVAVAIMLYILDGAQGNIKSHPTLECLFTAAEEKGLVGASGFDYGVVTATRMINMDSADESEIIVGCAGGQRSEIVFDTKVEPTSALCTKISLKGLFGGHSGEDINKGRANANKLMGRVLNSLCGKYEFSIASLYGGSKDNAIPRECEAVICSEQAEEIKKEAELIERDIRESLKECDGDFSITVSDCERAKRALGAEQTEKIITLLATAPNGVFSMSEGLCGVVEYSRNLGIVEIDASRDTGMLVFMSRSPKASQIKASGEELDAYARLLGGRHICAGSYPGWDGNASSPLCRLYSDCYRRLFGSECRATVIHAGLECAVIKQRLPELDIISCGAIVLDLHSPDEALNIDSFERFFAVIAAMLEERE